MKLEEDGSYKLSGVVVREFRGKKFLSTAKENCKLEKIDDIGLVAEGSDEEPSNLFDHQRPTEVNCYY